MVKLVDIQGYNSSHVVSTPTKKINQRIEIRFFFFTIFAKQCSNKIRRPGGVSYALRHSRRGTLFLLYLHFVYMLSPFIARERKENVF